MVFVALLIFAYFLGAVPFGLLLGRAFADVDVRSMGSGNIGATNVNRVLGRKLGAATLFCDIAKGILVVLLAKILVPGAEIQHAWVGFSAFIGHCFPIYLGFNGGKGVATMFGVLAVMSFSSALISFVIWISVARLTKISSLGALSTSVVVPFFSYYFLRNLGVTFVFCVMMTILVYRHKDNIRRIKAGKEA